MVYNADLGYDPEEWEECPHKEQIILFSFFTRLLLSSAAVAFVAYFFWMIDGHKHKDGKQEELNQQPTDTIITEVSRRLEELADSRKEKKSAPSETAEDLLREADDYMKDIRPLPQNFAQFVEKPCQRAHEALQEGSPFAERFVDDDRELAWKQQQIAVGLGTFGQPHGKVITESRRKISKEDEQALRQWELEREMLEAERLAKLQDHEAGGDESDRTSGLLPASHISMPSRSTQDGEDSFGRGFDQDNHPFNGLERKLLTEIGQIAQSTPTLKQDSFRDSELTDYDISDFHANEVGFDNGTAPAADVHFVRHERSDVFPKADPNVPTSISETSRATTRNIQGYIQVQKDPIYDKPPNNGKQISPEEAKQFQELCKEYDFGVDLGQDNQNSSQLYPVGPPPPSNDLGEPIVQAPLRDEVTKNVYDVQIKQIPPPLTDFSNDDLKNIVNAEMFVADAIEYLGHQQGTSPSTAFVIEEDMLSSQTSQKLPKPQNQPLSGDPTSYQIKTMEVFERVEHDEHDDVTYAPEIQSLEIPPDQMSENSDNFQEYFDRTAAEGQLESRVPNMSSTSAQRAGFMQEFHLRKQTSLLSVIGVTSMQEILLSIDSLDALSVAMRKAGLERTNLIFGIDYTASNKYQGEDSFGGRSLHTIHPNIKNPYQQVITILGRTLAPFASIDRIPVYGFGDAKTGDWSVFSLKQDGDCTSLDEVLKFYNEVTPTVDLSGPTNFAPLIYQAMEICQQTEDYHILVIIADGQVTNERATRRAIVQACQYPLSIIVVGVGDGPWEMMKVFDESLPKRPWDNFHFTEFHEIMRHASGQDEGDVKLAVQSLLEIPDQYRCICELGLLKNRTIPPRGSEIRKEIATA